MLDKIHRLVFVIDNIIKRWAHLHFGKPEVAFRNIKLINSFMGSE